MFTGIVQARCKVSAVAANAFGVRLTVDVTHWRPAGGYTPGHGDSICVSGACLTIAELGPGRLSFDVIAETLAKTTLGELKTGDEVNIEPAVLPSQPLGGHFMQGHVDGVGVVTHVKNTPEEWRTRIRPPADMLPSIVPKGSIAIDGVSLTLASVQDDQFEVALIPTTLELTTLAARKVGDRVNLEADVITKTVVQYLERFAGQGGSAGRLTLDKLRDAGMA